MPVQLANRSWPVTCAGNGLRPPRREPVTERRPHAGAAAGCGSGQRGHWGPAGGRAAGARAARAP
eukprot:15390072-Alexandrium_andersonii.AAC.1